jgi:tetratricopeptide (TPR) repeat protein
VERVHLHQQVGTALEELYGVDKESVAAADITAIAPQLARHFQEARNAEKAIHYLRQAGERAVQLSAYEEGIAHLTKALALLMSLPDSPERAQRELSLQISLGKAWKASIPNPEGERVLTRARELCLQTGETEQLCRIVSELSIFPYVRAEHHRARELAEEVLRYAQSAQDPLLVALGHWHLGYVLFALGEYTAARTHLQSAISFYKPQEHHESFVSVLGSDAGMSALAYHACCLWCLGFPEQALKSSQQALTLARELDHAFSLADVLCYGGCVFNEMLGEVQALEESAEELTQLSRVVGFSSFSDTGICYRGEALSKLGRAQDGLAQMREGLASRQSKGALCSSSGILGGLAQAQAAAGQPADGLETLDEALALVEDTGERYYEAELHRLKGALCC